MNSKIPNTHHIMIYTFFILKGEFIELTLNQMGTAYHGQPQLVAVICQSPHSTQRKIYL